MNILIVNGTPHKSSGYYGAHALVDAFQQPGDVVDEVTCPIDGLGLCNFEVCGAKCVTEGEDLCPHIEALRPILQKLDAADLLVVTTPTYCYHVAASLKILLEHLCWRWMRHRPCEDNFHRQAVVIATAAGAGADKPAQDVVDNLGWLGYSRIYTVKQSMGAMDWTLAKKSKQDALLGQCIKMGEKLKHGQVPMSMSVRGKFRLMTMLQKKYPTGAADQAFWTEKGWL